MYLVRKCFKRVIIKCSDKYVQTIQKESPHKIFLQNNVNSLITSKVLSVQKHFRFI